MIMRALRNLVVAAGLMGGLLVGAAPAASASTPCNVAPNYCHFDADGVLAAQSGASVSGTIYWDNASRSHFYVTLRDPLPGNGRDAIVEVLYRSDGRWRTYGSWYTNSSGYVAETISWPGHYIDQIQFRVIQRGDPAYRWAVDVNSYLGA
jgi:hypothetical protein